MFLRHLVFSLNYLSCHTYKKLPILYKKTILKQLLFLVPIGTASTGYTTFQLGISRHYAISEKSSSSANKNQISGRNDLISDFLKFDDELQEELEGSNFTTLPTYSNQFADFANSSKILQLLLSIGVDLYTVEKKWHEARQFLLVLDFNKDIEPKVKYLKDIGIIASEFGQIFTLNPMLLDPNFSLLELKERIDYLRSKKFSKEEIASIVCRYPQFLNVPVIKLDGILGFYQSFPTNYQNVRLRFKGNELRSIIVKCPRLINADLEEAFFVVKQLQMSCQFTVSQIRNLILHRPANLLTDREKIEDLYKFYANEMKIPNELLAKNELLFTTRVKVIRMRHEYLKFLGRDRYREDEPGYIWLYYMIAKSNEEFCKVCNLGPVENFEKFMKTF